jgi:hypothetical protein
MKKSQLAYGLVIVPLLMTAAIAYGAMDKQDVCHITGTYEFSPGIPTPIGHVINIADPAWPAHEEHGDPAVHVPVTLDDGSVVCTASTNTDKVLFSTSSEYQGNLVGAANALLSTNFGVEDGGAAADAICQYHADRVRDNNLHVPEGTYIAVISSSDRTARSVLDDADGPIVDSRGDELENTWSDIFVNVPIIRDIRIEDGGYGGGAAWTGSDNTGAWLSAYDCTEWTSTSGGGRYGRPYTTPQASGGSPSSWISDGNDTCGDGTQYPFVARLYCIQQ